VVDTGSSVSDCKPVTGNVACFAVLYFASLLYNFESWFCNWCDSSGSALYIVSGCMESRFKATRFMELSLQGL